MAAASSSFCYPSTIGAIEVTKYGEIATANDVLHFNSNKSFPKVDTLGANDIVVKIAAASINPLDYKIIKGLFSSFLPLPFPYTPGYDLSGTVVGIGSGVHRLKVGDRIFADVGEPKAFCEYTIINERLASVIPSSLSFTDAAAFPLISLTAYQAFHTVNKLSSTNRVLILGGAGGVGHVAIQLAKAAGAFVVTTSSPRNIDFVRQFGADMIIDYTKENWIDQIKDEKFSIVFECAPSNALKLIEEKGLLSSSGHFVSVMGPAPNDFSAPFKYTFLLTSTNGNVFEQLDFISKLVEKNQLKVNVSQIFPFNKESAVKMFQQSYAGKTIGKLVMKISSD